MVELFTSTFNHICFEEKQKAQGTVPLLWITNCVVSPKLATHLGQANNPSPLTPFPKTLKKPAVVHGFFSLKYLVLAKKRISCHFFKITCFHFVIIEGSQGRAICSESSNYRRLNMLFSKMRIFLFTKVS